MGVVVFGLLKNNMNKVSVIIPTYNSSKYINECIESALNQTIKPLEIIVVDDGSTDDTESILKEYIGQNKITYIKKENGGPASARNKGVSLANGDYIAFLDADDIWTKTKLEEQLIMAVTKNADIVHTGRFFISENKQQKKDTIRIKDSLSYLIKNNYIVNSSVLIKKEIIKKYMFSELGDMFAVEDYFLWLNLKSLVYKFIHIDKPLVGYRIHKNQISQDALGNTIKLYLNIFKNGLTGKISIYCKLIALYKFLKLKLYRLKITK